MKKIAIVVAALGLSLAVAGCNTPQERAAAEGGLIGAAAGAVIGAATTGRASGALAGAAIGGASGAVLGAATTPNRRCIRAGYDYDGNRICRRWEYY